jgi:hypothetical protein
MKKEIIYTEHYALIVSELTSPGKEGQVFLSKENIIHTVVGWNYGDRVIIAHRPLTDAPILEGVPLLPEFSQEDSIKDYSLDTAKEFALNHFNDLEPKYRKGGYITIKSILDVLKIGVECGHKFGLKQAKETYKYTEDDLIECILFGMKKGLSVGKIPETDNDWINNHVKSLQQPKLPKYFECEIEYIHDVTVPYPKTLGTKPKTTTNPQGQIELVGEYIYE